MTAVRPTDEQITIYAKFCHYLNQSGGKLQANSAIYYKFLDDNLVEHTYLARAILLCHKMYKAPTPYVLHVDGRTVGIEGGSFYLTTSGRDNVFGINPISLPPIPKVTKSDNVAVVVDKNIQKKEDDWTQEEVIKLLTTQAHVVGRMLGTGYDLLEPIHGEWIMQWLLNPGRFRVVIHQAHRDSYKSASLRLACAGLTFSAIFLLLQSLRSRACIL